MKNKFAMTIQNVLYSKLFIYPKDCALFWTDIGWNDTACVLCVHSVFKIHGDCKNAKCSRYMPDVAQRVGTGIALLFHDRDNRRGWVVSSAPRPHLTPGKDPVPIVQEDGWAPGPAWKGGKSRPHRDSIPDSFGASANVKWLSQAFGYIIAFHPVHHIVDVGTCWVVASTRRCLPTTVSVLTL